jgi:hypothetical protein
MTQFFEIFVRKVPNPKFGGEEELNVFGLFPLYLHPLSLKTTLYQKLPLQSLHPRLQVVPAWSAHLSSCTWCWPHSWPSPSEPRHSLSSLQPGSGRWRRHRMDSTVNIFLPQLRDRSTAWPPPASPPNRRCAGRCSHTCPGSPRWCCQLPRGS